LTCGADIAVTALRYKGVPYMHKGRSRNGLDCIGLVIVVLRDLGLLRVDEEPDYGCPPDADMLRKTLLTYLEPGDPDEPGAVLLFRFVKEPQHVAIRTEYGIVHCYARVNRVVETTFDPSWRKRLVAAYRFSEAH
jgi:cell wall-associated NlpC family hydrolase